MKYKVYFVNDHEEQLAMRLDFIVVLEGDGHYSFMENQKYITVEAENKLDALKKVQDKVCNLIDGISDTQGLDGRAAKTQDVGGDDVN